MIVLIITLSKVIIVFRIHRYKTGKLFFPIKSFITLLLRFDIKISLIIEGCIFNHLGTKIQRKFKGLIGFLKYNPVLHPNQIYCFQKPIL